MLGSVIHQKGFLTTFFWKTLRWKCFWNRYSVKNSLTRADLTYKQLLNNYCRIVEQLGLIVFTVSSKEWLQLVDNTVPWINKRKVTVMNSDTVNIIKLLKSFRSKMDTEANSTSRYLNAVHTVKLGIIDQRGSIDWPIHLRKCAN